MFRPGLVPNSHKSCGFVLRVPNSTADKRLRPGNDEFAVGIVRACGYVIHTWRIADKGRFAR